MKLPSGSSWQRPKIRRRWPKSPASNTRSLRFMSIRRSTKPAWCSMVQTPCVRLQKGIQLLNPTYKHNQCAISAGCLHCLLRFCIDNAKNRSQHPHLLRNTADSVDGCIILAPYPTRSSLVLRKSVCVGHHSGVDVLS